MDVWWIVILRRVLKYRTKNKLLPLVKNNVFTPQEEDYMDIDNDNKQLIEERFSIKLEYSLIVLVLINNQILKI